MFLNSSEVQVYTDYYCITVLSLHMSYYYCIVCRSVLVITNTTCFYCVQEALYLGITFIIGWINLPSVCEQCPPHDDLIKEHV